MASTGPQTNLALPELAGRRSLDLKMPAVGFASVRYNTKSVAVFSQQERTRLLSLRLPQLSEQLTV